MDLRGQLSCNNGKPETSKGFGTPGHNLMGRDSAFPAKGCTLNHIQPGLPIGEKHSPWKPPSGSPSLDLPDGGFKGMSGPFKG